MPCESAYMEPSQRERESQRMAGLLVYLRQELGMDRDPQAEAASQSIYGGRDYAPDLCRILRGMTTEQMESIVYNPRNRMARDLANWWEDHQEVDRKREAKEAADRELAAKRKAALEKLSPEERKVLGLNDAS